MHHHLHTRRRVARSELGDLPRRGSSGGSSPGEEARIPPVAKSHCEDAPAAIPFPKQYLEKTASISGSNGLGDASEWKSFPTNGYRRTDIVSRTCSPTLSSHCTMVALHGSADCNIIVLFILVVPTICGPMSAHRRSLTIAHCMLVAFVSGDSSSSSAKPAWPLGARTALL